MATLSPAQVYALARGAGLDPPSAVVATAIAGAESGYRTDAPGDQGLVGQKAPNGQHWGPSLGLWQIRSIQEQYGTGQPRDASRLTDPSFNAQSMASISGSGKNFGAWSTYKNGAFQKFMGASAGAANTDMGPLGNVVAGAVGNAVGAVGSAVGSAVSSLNPFSGWQASVLKIGGGLTAAVLIVLGAVHTVSEKG